MAVQYLDEPVVAQGKGVFYFDELPVSKPVAPIQPPEIPLGTTREERAALLPQRGAQARIAQAAKMAYVGRDMADIIRQVQQDIDAGVAVDPAVIAQYQDYLDLPEPVPVEPVRQEPAPPMPPVQPEPALVEPVIPPPPIQAEPTFEERRRQAAINIARADAELLAKQAEVAPSIGEIMLGEESVSGDVLRSAASLASAVGAIFPSTLRGVLDIPGIKQLAGDTAAGKLLSKWADKLANNEAELASEIGKRSGSLTIFGAPASEVGQKTANAMITAAANVGILGLSKVFSGGAKLIPNIKAAGKLAALGYAQTPGTQAEKLKAATLMGVFALTPIPARKMPQDWMAKAVNIVENLGISEVAGHGLTSDLPWTDKIPQALLDTVFGAVAKGRGPRLPAPTPRAPEPTVRPEPAVTPEKGKVEFPQRIEVSERMEQPLPEAPKAEPEKIVLTEGMEVPKKEVPSAAEERKIEKDSVLQRQRDDAQREADEAVGGYRTDAVRAEPTPAEPELGKKEAERVAPEVEAEIPAREAKPVAEKPIVEEAPVARPFGITEDGWMQVVRRNSRETAEAKLESIKRKDPSGIYRIEARESLTGLDFWIEKAPPKAPPKTKIEELKTKMAEGRKETGISAAEQEVYLLDEIDAAIAALPPDGIGEGKIKIKVPGDGTFTVFNDKQILEKFRKAVKSRLPAQFRTPTSKPSQDKSADEAIKQYGNAEKAANVIERQAENPEFTEAQRNVFSSLVAELRDRANITNVPEHQLSDRIEEIRAKVAAKAYDIERSKEMQEAKLRAQKGLEALKQHPRYAELQRALSDKFTKDKIEKGLPEDGDLLNVSVEGRGAPAIRNLQDIIGKDIGISRGRPIKTYQGVLPGKFNLERYWKDIAQEYTPEEPAIEAEKAPPVKPEIPPEREAGVAAKGDIDIVAKASKISKAEQTQKGGFVTALPGAERVADIGKTVMDWAKLRLTTGKGQPAEWGAIETAARNRGNMFDIHQKLVRNKVATAVKELGKTMDEAAVNKSVTEVLNGTKSIDQFKADFRLPDTDPVVQELKWVLNDRSKTSDAIAEQLDLQGKKDLAEIVRKNRGAYLTRFYAKHILGSSFIPEQADFQAAVEAVKSNLSAQVDKLGKRASSLGRIMAKARGEPALTDAQKFIETGDIKLLSGLNARQQDFARLLRDRYAGMRDLVKDITVDPAAIRKGKLIELTQNEEALSSAARDTVDYILGNEPTGKGRGSGPIDLNHLTRRALTPVFRRLFQEVDTPIEAAQKTAEVQGHMLVGLETLNKITVQGEGKWWTRSAPDKARGLTERLEGKRFGKLDGAFVGKATAELLGSFEGRASEAMRMFENLVHYQRGVQVALSFPTTERNLLSGLASFAVAPGDVFRPNYRGNLKTAAGFVFRLAKAREGTTEYTKLLETLRDLAGKGVFHVKETSVSADIMTRETPFGKSPSLLDRFFSPLGKLQNKAGRAYAFGDFITKYASYLTQKGMGKTDTQAAEHVQKFYQHPSSLPTGLRWFSKLPFADYPTYTFDSIRIKKNEIIHAAESAAKGDLIPLLGFALSNGIYALAAGGTSWVKDMMSDKVKQKINALPDEQLRAMKEFQPDYWQNTPMFARMSKDEKGNPVIDYVVTGNLFAFPLDDVVMGAIQNRKFSSFLEGSFQLFGKMGMTPNSLAKLFVGQEVGLGASYYKTKGLADIARSDSDHKLAETMGLIGKTVLELAIPVPRRVQHSFRKWKALDEKLEVGRISQEDAQEQKADMIMSEVLPMKIRTITRDVGHDMMFNTFKPSNDTIDELDRTIGRGIKSDATAAQKQEGKEAEADLRNKYNEMIEKTRLAQVAFKGVMSVDDVRRTIMDIFGDTRGRLILQGRLDDLIENSLRPSRARRQYEKGREEPY